jgi:hypothetical protein
MVGFFRCPFGAGSAVGPSLLLSAKVRSAGEVRRGSSIEDAARRFSGPKGKLSDRDKCGQGTPRGPEDPSAAVAPGITGRDDPRLHRGWRQARRRHLWNADGRRSHGPEIIHPFLAALTILATASSPSRDGFQAARGRYRAGIRGRVDVGQGGRRQKEGENPEYRDRSGSTCHCPLRLFRTTIPCRETTGMMGM